MISLFINLILVSFCLWLSVCTAICSHTQPHIHTNTHTHTYVILVDTHDTHRHHTLTTHCFLSKHLLTPSLKMPSPIFNLFSPFFILFFFSFFSFQSHLYAFELEHLHTCTYTAARTQAVGTDEWTVACQSILLRTLRTYHGVERGYSSSGADTRVVSVVFM